MFSVLNHFRSYNPSVEKTSLNMGLNDKIKQLKELAIVHNISLTYDFCPNEKKVDLIIEEMEEQEVSFDKEVLVGLLRRYEGWDCGDVEQEILSLIRKL